MLSDGSKLAPDVWRHSYKSEEKKGTRDPEASRYGFVTWLVLLDDASSWFEACLWVVCWFEAAWAALRLRCWRCSARYCCLTVVGGTKLGITVLPASGPRTCPVPMLALAPLLISPPWSFPCPASAFCSLVAASVPSPPVRAYKPCQGAWNVRL